MAIKKYKPTTPSRRNMTVPDYKQVITKDTPEKSLVVIKKKNAGRNSYGRITVRHRGGGNKVVTTMDASQQDIKVGDIREYIV